MKRIRILPYKMGSEGAKSLSEELQGRGIDCLRVRSDGDYKPRIGDLVVLWGHGWKPGWWSEMKGVWALNHPESIADAVFKPSSFRLMEGKCNHVPYTRDRETAVKWHKKHTVCVRHNESGMDGDGLELFHPSQLMDMPSADLYTQFIPSEAEFRIHVFNGRAIIWQRKGQSPDGSPLLGDCIRTEHNGYAFRKTALSEVPEPVLAEAVKAVNALNLDFGGVDMLWDGKEAWVLEVNTAPAIAGTDIETYADNLMALGGF